MEFVLIIIVTLGIGFALYTFFSSSGEVKNKHQRENTIYDLKQQVISQNVKLQKLEFERTGLADETEKIKKALEAAKAELEEAHANENAMREDLQNMRLAEDNNKSGIDLLRAENESLKEKLIEKENGNKKLADQVKELTVKLNSALAEKEIQPDKKSNAQSQSQASDLPKNIGQNTRGNDIINDIDHDA